MESTPLRCLTLVRGLPYDSAFHRSLLGGVPWGWQEEALTSLVELMVAHIRVTLAAAGAKRHQIPKPVSITRPYTEATRSITPKRPASVKEVVETLGAMFTRPPGR